MRMQQRLFGVRCGNALALASGFIATMGARTGPSNAADPKKNLFGSGLPAWLVFVLSALLAAAPAAAATLKVSSFPSGAQVSVDGQSTGKATPMNISLAEGDHTLTCLPR